MEEEHKPSHNKRKRTRYLSTTDEEPVPEHEPPRNQLALTLDLPTGPKVVHINTTEYRANPNDIVGELWIPKRTADYIFKILMYYNHDSCQFPIHHLPTDNVQWSVVDLNPSVMHKTYKTRPLLIWIAGTLINYVETSSIDDPIPRLRVMIDFLRTTDRDAAMTLYNSSSSGTIRRLDNLEITSPTRDDDGPASYDQVYDATRRLESKANMRKIPLSRIEGGDLVLVECTLVRTEGIAQIKNVSFALNALYWLAEKPRRPRTKVTPTAYDLSTVIEA